MGELPEMCMQKSTDAELDAYVARLDRRRWWLIILAVLAVLGILFGLLSAAGIFTRVHWIGSHELDVHVLVLDARTQMPIPKAMVTLFDGPSHPLEIRPENLSKIHFGPDADHANPLQGETDQQGRVVLTRRFMAHGTYSRYSEVGSVLTSKVWAEVSAPGYGTVIIPVGGQDGKPREIQNKGPVYLTVMLSR
ncbi:hypothetical protein CA54_27150 [Symmachiella macrocystis]|uniref:Uncharacterized protein n=1 Tax=Symmachiella macrocystis TaxID=2527985 RepID=A0A5C6BPC4_9PLAN|nr:hypothetical protein [Symmachiella macrocystis]TWU13875.1 hypothetical protein CA54_27150 [Symmachiella macrocystis]